MRTNSTCKRVLFTFFIFLALFAESLQAQTENACDERPTYLYWVGGASNDFFDEANWRLANKKVFTTTTGTVGEPECKPGMQPKFVICPRDFNPEDDKVPAAGTLDPGAMILYNLYMANADVTISSPLVFSCIDKGLNIHSSKLTVNAPVTGTLHLDNSSTVRIASPSFGAGLRISLQDYNSWVYFDKINPAQLAQLPLSSWMVNYLVPANLTPLLLNQYYQHGSVVRRNPADYSPLTVYDDIGFDGSSTTVGIDNIYAGSAIPGDMNRKIRSFKLRRGFMVTLAVNSNGTGKSQVFIASEKDLELPDLPASLSGNVSFIRVLPWNWVSKKGTGGSYPMLDAGWYYSWSATQNTRLNYEYVPMTWGAGTTNPQGIKAIIDKDKVTHLLGFNESDNCNGESGQFLNLCQPEVAVAYYERLMGSGLRLGTPAPRENGPTTWLRQFAALAKERNVRFDFVAVHWYDWGSNPSSSPFADPQQVFNRFKAYLQQVYSEYKLPIWITEFNANPNRDNSVQAAFLQLALPYLETLSYVERYAYFQPNRANATTTANITSANYLDGSTLTNIGQLYLDHTSTPSMPDSTYQCANNLNGLDQPLPVMQEQQFVFEAECGKFPGSKWTVGEDPAASNGKYLKGNTQAAGETSLSTQVHFDFEVTEEAPFRVWVRARSSTGIMVIQIDHDRFDTIRSVNSTSFQWISVPRLYSFKPGAHRVSLALVNNITEFDQVAVVAGSDDVNSPVQGAGYCEPEAFVWGREAPAAPIFAEAEVASLIGGNWSVRTDDKAIGGQFVQSGVFASPASAPGNEGRITFSLDVAAAGAYQFWAKLQALDASATQLWIKIDNDEFRPWNGLQQNNYLWKWKRYDPASADLTRQEYLFLEPGAHTFTLAYASGEVMVDRVALMPAGGMPAAIDPDVIVESGPQSFEAEEATLLGTATIVNCVTSSNGKQVNLGNVGTNGVRFTNVLAGSNGTYQLVIHYMTAVQRNLRVIVNGTQLPLQRMVMSGAWCFLGGSPGTWYMSVNLNSGENVIDLRPVAGTEAPFIDKIEVRPALASLEAELAEISGNSTIVSCVRASNAGLVNMNFLTTNAVQFNDISVPVSGIYNLNISYISEPVRTMKMSIDGDAGTSLSFPSSGPWCASNGAPVVKSVQLHLTQGVHTIRFQPNSGEAPLLDKVDIVATVTDGEEQLMTGILPLESAALATMRPSLSPLSGKLFPNPARPGASVHIPLMQGRQAAIISIFDARGAMIRRTTQGDSSGYTLPYVTPGIYLIKVEQAGQSKIYRLMVQ